MILLLLLALPAVLIYLIRKNKTNATLPPGPPQLPLIGNLHQFVTATNLHTYLWNLSNKYGTVMHMKLGPTPVVIVSSEKMAKQVLRTLDSTFCSRPKLRGQRKLSYDCLDIAFSPYNDHWREMRRNTYPHLFSIKKAQSSRPIRADEIAHLVRKIQGFATHQAVINLSELVMEFTLKLLRRIAFGNKYDQEIGSSEKLRFIELMKEAQTALVTIYVSDYLPAFSWVDKVRGVSSQLDSTFKNLDSLYQELIDEHLNHERGKENEEESILDPLIQLKQDKSMSNDFTWDHIKGLLMNILIAGTETSASTIISAMTALMKSTNIMKKVQAEIREKMGKKGKVEEEDIQNLPYLKAVIYETFRLYPPVPLLVLRETMGQCMLDHYQIQPKTMVFVNAFAVGRDPEYWENPDEFFPERFLNKNVDVKGKDFGLIPFGSGRRVCPGAQMGLATVELALANLLYLFDWELPTGMQEDDVDTEASPGITLHKKIALRLVPNKFTI